MNIVFFLMGLLSGVAIFLLGYINIRYRCPWYVNIFGVVAAALVIFTVGWYGSSIVEGESQAAKVGLLMFGVPGLLLIAIAWFSFRKKNPRPKRA